MDLTICVATFGEARWVELAHDRAMPSARAQGCPVVYVHGDTLHQARNEAARQATTPMVCWLDADDELAPGYAEAMCAGTADMRAPALLECHPDGRTVAVDVESRDIERLNPCCVGTVVRRSMALESPWPGWPAWEDWAFYLRLHRRGAILEHIGNAVYLQHVRKNSRNRTVQRPRDLHAAIRAWA